VLNFLLVCECTSAGTCDALACLVHVILEGSRTRTGKPSIPKGGLVSVLVDTVMEGKVDSGIVYTVCVCVCVVGIVNDIYIVPVNISYDKVCATNVV